MLFGCKKESTAPTPSSPTPPTQHHIQIVVSQPNTDSITVAIGNLQGNAWDTTTQTSTSYDYYITTPPGQAHTVQAQNLQSNTDSLHVRAYVDGNLVAQSNSIQYSALVFVW
mgnify:CR=1 FL=1